jgi:hypothetical protein
MNSQLTMIRSQCHENELRYAARTSGRAAGGDGSDPAAGLRGSLRSLWAKRFAPNPSATTLSATTPSATTSVSRAGGGAATPA